MTYYSQTTLLRLGAESGNECAFPGCGVAVVDLESESRICEVCHIRARNAGGPRYDPTQTDAERNSAGNLILLCANHHTIVDDDLATYTVDYLQQLKADHEQKHRSGSLDRATLDKLLQALKEQVPPILPSPDAIAEGREQLTRIPIDTVPAISPPPPGSHIAFAHNRDFVGRDREMLTLARAVTSGDAAVVSAPVIAATGIGGMGKTQLVSEFVHHYGRFFIGGVFWLDFEFSERVEEQIAACGLSPQLAPYLPSQFTSLSTENQARLVRAAWEGGLPCLLVFDNCEAEELLSRWRPKVGDTRTIVTSRRGTWDEAGEFTLVQLHELQRESSIELVRRHRPGVAVSDPEADRLAQLLGDLPLAVHTAARFLGSHPRVAIAAYIEQLEREDILGHPSLQDDSLSPTGHTLDVARTFVLSYEQLDAGLSQDALALRLLHCGAYFAAGEAIPVMALYLTCGISPDDAGALALADGALSQLVQLGLIEPEVRGAVRIHRLMAQFARNSSPTLEPLAAALSSPIPDVAREAAAVVQTQLPSHQDSVGSLASGLSRSQYAWTRHHALRLAMSCGESYVDLTLLRDELDPDRARAHRKQNEPSLDLWVPYSGSFISDSEDRLTLERLRFLIEHDQSAETQNLVGRVYERGRVSSGRHHRLRELLLEHKEYQDIVEQVDAPRRQLDEQITRIIFGDETNRAAETNLLSCIREEALRLSNGNETPHMSDDVHDLARLVRGMHWGEETHMRLLAHPPDPTAISSVVRAAIAALGSPEDVAAQAAWAIEHVGEGSLSTLLRTSQDVATLDWPRAAEVELDLEALARALSNPVDMVRLSAAELFAAGIGGSASRQLLLGVLESDDEDALWLLGQIAGEIWGDEAIGYILARLGEGVTTATAHLLPALSQLPGSQTNEQSTLMLVQTLESDNVIAASYAAATLLDGDFESVHAYASRLHQALVHWMERGSECSNHGGPVYEDACPECHLTVPDPVSPLSRLLARLDALPFEDVLLLCQSPNRGVRESGIEALKAAIENDSAHMREVLVRVKDGTLPVEALDQVFSAQSTALAQVRRELVQLLSSPRSRVRQRTLRSLARKPAWLSTAEALPLVEPLLLDPDAKIRDAALETLRALAAE